MAEKHYLLHISEEKVCLHKDKAVHPG
ncbi:uncharacterized protein METZ01_LOCUS42200, partial [marine metagenome]